MKHISKFKLFESLSILDQKELSEFCDDYLINLYDRGFKISFTTAPRSRNSELIDVNRVFITLSISDGAYTAINFTWKDVRDSFIPFVDMLNDSYVLGDFEIGNHPSRRPIRFTSRSPKTALRSDKYKTLEEVMNNDLSIRRLTPESITIMVFSKK